MSSKMTVTEGLAEIKTLDKRLEKKLDSIIPFLIRQDRFKDPLEKEGGSVTFIQRERQAIHDLHTRKIAIRAAISAANVRETISIDNDEWSIQDWLNWRREVAPKLQALYTRMRQAIDQMRREATQKGLTVTTPDAVKQSTDVIVNINEQELAADIERLETVLGRLDGLLSLKNATVMIEVD